MSGATIYRVCRLLKNPKDGLPPLIAYVFSAGLDVLIAQVLIGGTGLFILWLRWREARRLQREHEEALDLEAQSENLFSS